MFFFFSEEDGRIMFISVHLKFFGYMMCMFPSASKLYLMTLVFSTPGQLDSCNKTSTCTLDLADILK